LFDLEVVSNEIFYKIVIGLKYREWKETKINNRNTVMFMDSIKWRRIIHTIS